MTRTSAAKLLAISIAIALTIVGAIALGLGRGGTPAHAATAASDSPTATGAATPGSTGAPLSTSTEPAMTATNSARPATITVIGTGTVSGTPDTVMVSLGVQTTGPAIADAMSQANKAATAVIDKLKASGVDAKDISTSSVSLQPNYDNNGKPNGYQVYEGVRAVLRDLAKAGQLMGDAVSAGGDAARVEGISFDLDGKDGLMAKARSSAMADARSKAGEYAAAEQRTVGAVLSISESTSGDGSPMPYAKDAAASRASAAGPVPLNPGSQDVQVQVSVTYELG